MNNLLTRPASSREKERERERERVNIRNPFKRFTLYYYVHEFVYKSATVTTATSAARWMAPPRSSQSLFKMLQPTVIVF
jgi:hypothetical protein